MWHHAEYIALFIANAGDVFDSSVGITVLGDISFFIAITEQHLIIFVDLLEGSIIAIKTAFSVCNRNFYGLSDIEFRCDHRLVSFATQVYVLADELVIVIMQQSTW